MLLHDTLSRVGLNLMRGSEMSPVELHNTLEDIALLKKIDNGAHAKTIADYEARIQDYLPKEPEYHI